MWVEALGVGVTAPQLLTVGFGPNKRLVFLVTVRVVNAPSTVLAWALVRVPTTKTQAIALIREQARGLLFGCVCRRLMSSQPAGACLTL